MIRDIPVVFSRRVSFDPTPNAFSQLVRSVSETAQLRDLTLSNPTRAALGYRKQELSAALAAARVDRYAAESFGSLEAREVIAKLWHQRGMAVSADQVALTASTSEAYAQLFKLFCDPGDRVLVPRPSYPLLAELAKYEAVELVDYALGYDGSWHIDVESIARLVTDRVKAVVVVSPNNPTGNRLKRSELEALLNLGLPLICDEVFGAYELQEVANAVWAVEARHGLVISLDGLSKFACLPQMKLAWMTFAGDSALVEVAMRRLEFVLDAYLSVGGPVQDSLDALLAAAEDTRLELCDRLKANLRIVDDVCRGSAVTRLDVEGGWYAVLRLPNLMTEDDWVSQLLLQRRVLVQPGWFYDFEMQPVCVVSLLVESEELRSGTEALVQFVQLQCEAC